MASRELAIRITGDPRSLSRAFDQVRRDAGRTEGHLRRGFGAIAKSAAVAGAAIGAGLAAAAKVGIGELMQQEKASAQTAATLRSTAGAAKITQKEIEGLASALQDQTGVADDAIQSGENLLLTFTNIRNEAGRGNDIFTRATKTMLDMSTALGQDVKSSAIQLGKALNDPVRGVTALQRVGVSFTKDQKEQIRTLVESGKTLEAQKLILRELNREFGGSAQAFGDTRAGQIEKIKRRFEDMTEALAAGLLPAFDRLTAVVNAAMPHLQRLIGGAFGAIQEVATAAWPTVRDGFGRAVEILRDLWSRVGPILSDAIERAVPLIRRISGDIVEVFRALAPKLRPVMRIVGQLVEDLARLIRAVVDRIADFWDRWGKDIMRITRRVFGVLADIIRPALQVVRGVIQTVTALIEGDWGKVWAGLKLIAINLLKALARAITGLGGLFLDAAKALGKKIADGIANGLKAVGRKIVDFIWGLVPGPLRRFLQGGDLAGGTPTDVTTITGQRRAAGGVPGITRASGGFLPGASGAPVRVTAHAGEVILNPRQQRIVGIDRIIGALRATGGIVGGDGAAFASGGVIADALRFARAQVGEPYVWGGGHSFGDARGWDCSGFASNVAARVPGYSGGIGTTMSLYPISKPARGGEPVVFGFRGMSSRDPRRQHMGIRVAGTWFSAGAGGVRIGDSRWDSLRIPPGLEWLAEGNGPDPGPAVGVQRTLGRAAAAITHRLSTLLTRSVLSGTTGAMEVPTSAGAEQAGRMASTRAITQGLRAGRSPDEIREAADDAQRRAQIGWYREERQKARVRRLKVIHSIRTLRHRLKRLAKGMPRRGPQRAAVGRALATGRARLRNLLNELAGLNAWLAEIANQLAELNLAEAEDAADDARAAAELAADGGGGAEERSPGDGGGGAEERSPFETAQEALQAQLALAELTPGTEDDLAALRQLLGLTEGELSAAQTRGDNAAIITLAGTIKSLRESIERLTGATDENTQATREQTFTGSVSFGFRGQRYLVRQTSDTLVDVGVGI